MVRAPGYKPMTQAYTVAQKNDPLRFKLEPMQFLLTVRTTPEDAHVTARGKSGDHAQPIDLGFVDGAVNVVVSKSGFEKKQRTIGLDAFTERDGVMVAEIDVGLRRLGAPAEGAPAAEPTSGGAPAPVEAAPEPTPDPEPEARPAPAPEPEREPEPEPAPRPAPKPKPEPEGEALPDNPF
jgi:hypothetical protein